MSQFNDSNTELEQIGHEARERREWFGERIGWIAMGLIIGCALLGLLGSGPLNKRVVTSDDGTLAIEYNAIERFSAPCRLKVIIRPPITGDTLRVRFSRTFSDSTKLENIVPEPIQTEAEVGNVVYTFRTSGNLQSELALIFRYEYETFGRVDFETGLGDRSRVKLSQWVLP